MSEKTMIYHVMNVLRGLQDLIPITDVPEVKITSMRVTEDINPYGVKYFRPAQQGCPQG